MKNTATQTDRIASLLQKGGSITPIQALNKFGCLRLSARINNLRDSGMNILTLPHTTPSGKRVAKYKLATP